LDFRSAYKVTTLGQDLIRNIYGKFVIDPLSRSSVSQLEASAAILDFGSA